MRIGVECGGTFTDLVVLDDDGRLIATDKVFSTPDNPTVAVVNALNGLSADVTRDARLLHGSTVATNALIERKGARIGLLTTRGFRDVVLLQRQDRVNMYDLTITSPTPLVERERIVEVEERLDARGNVVTDLSRESVRAALTYLVEQNVSAVAVSLLHSYANPGHERAVAEIAAAEFPDLVIALSSDSAREFREYERTTTTTVDAFLRPRISGYLNDLDTKTAGLGIADVSVMQSNGGMVPARTAALNPLSMLRSGPAAGVAGAIAVAEGAGLLDVVTMDMGGTSADVAVVHQGRAEQTAETAADGLPLRVPMIDITAVGAGGGSIVDVDSGGLLTVGPESAGASPGPVCYGLGGDKPTVTDANVVRGLVRPESFLGGTLTLDKDAAYASFQPLAERLGRSVEQLAEDVYELASVNMANAIRLTTTERGHEVEKYALLAYGGAGPLHAASVADQLGIKRVVVPPHNGLASAYGLLTAGFRREYARTHLADTSALTIDQLATLQSELADGAREQLAAQGIDLSDAEFDYSADMRYRGQGFEVAVDVDPQRPTDVPTLVERFHATHARRYGHSESDRAVQIVTLRLAVVKPRPTLALPRVEYERGIESRAYTIIEGDTEVSATFRDRRSVAAHERQPGPAVVVDTTSTTFVPTGWVAVSDQHTNLVLEKEERP